MLDKICIKTKLNRHAVDSLSYNSKKSTVHYGEFRNVQLPSGQSVQCYFDSRRTTLYSDCLALNPSHFESGSEVCKVVKSLTICNHQIKRIDFAADYPDFKVEQFYRSLFVAKKRKRTEFNSADLTGITIGKSPHQVKIYDRKFVDRTLKNHLVRIEVSFFGDKCPISTLDQLKELKNINPFQGIQFLEVVSLDLANTNNDRQKVCFLRDAIESKGLIKTYKELNQSNKFKRDYSKYLESSQAIIDPNKIFQSGFAKFIQNI